MAGSESRPVSARPPHVGPSRRHREVSPVLARGALALRGARPLWLTPAGAVPHRVAFGERCSSAPQRQVCLLHAARREAGRPVSPEGETTASPQNCCQRGALPGGWSHAGSLATHRGLEDGQRPEHRKGKGLVLPTTPGPETRLPSAGASPRPAGSCRAAARRAHVLAPVPLLAWCHLPRPEAQLASGTAALSLPGWSPLPSHRPCPAS